MKRIIVLTLTLAMMIVTFSGCSDRKDNASLLAAGKDGIKNVSVSSLPEGYNYSFSKDDADAIIDYLSDLNLIFDFEENPNEYAGMTWVISLEYENGDIVMVYHFGNMFIRADSGPWYKMNYEEASRLGELFGELSE